MSEFMKNVEVIYQILMLSTDMKTMKMLLKGQINMEF